MTNVNLLDYLVVVAKHKTFVIRFVLAAVSLAAILFFLILPRWYLSTAVVMPPKGQGMLGLSSLLSRSNLPLRSLGLGGSNTDLAQLKTILDSRSLMEMVLDSFRLMEVYKQPIREKAIKELRENVQISDGIEDVSIEVNVYDTDAQRAADMANYTVDQLNQIYLELSVREARSNRVFLERRYLQNIADLQLAQEEYKKFQQKYGAVDIPEQVKAAIEVAAKIKSQIAATEVELGILASTASPDNEIRRIKELLLDQLKGQMRNLVEGEPDKEQLNSIFPSFQMAPEIGMEYLNRYRELETQAKILELILPLYEQAKIEEQKNTPSVLVLDAAIPAYRATKPKRMFIMIGVAFGSLLFGILIAFVREYYQRTKADDNSDDLRKLDFIRKQLRFRDLLR